MSTILTDEQRSMVLANVPLVEHIVNRVAANLPASHSRDDLVQSGIMGLITATVRFDPDQGTAFSTFAGRRIEGAVIDMLRRADWAPRSVRSMERRLATAEDQRSALHSASGERLSRELGCDPRDIHALRRDIAKARLDSLDRPVSTENATVPLSATIIDERDRAEEIVDHQELIGYLRDGVSLLPERHRAIVVGYYFEGQSITDLGAYLGVSQSRASQIKDEALKLLRKGIQGVYRDPAAGPDAAPMSNQQQSFVDSVAGSRPWRERLTAGKGISVTG
ncbi:MAG: sigma-70 family RNA polymerase sigma factor [Acidimicrobiales bacterium]